MIAAEAVGRSQSGDAWDTGEAAAYHYTTWYMNFVVNCFVPCLLAAYNSIVQVLFVREVRDAILCKQG